MARWTGLGVALAAAAAVLTSSVPAGASPIPAAPPLISKVTPSAGPPTGGTSIVLRGHRFGTVMSVAFGSVPAAFVFVSHNTLDVVSPASAAGNRVHHGDDPAPAPAAPATARPASPIRGAPPVPAVVAVAAASAVAAVAVVGSRASTSGGAYLMAASDGGIFTFGGAPFKGSMGGRHLNAPIIGMAPTSTGTGYWLVASDGGVFAFGDAPYRRSMGGRHLNAPIVGMASTSDDQGYWLVASDGGVFAFGDAALPRLDGWHAPERAHRRHGGHADRCRLLAGGVRRRHLHLRKRQVQGSMGDRHLNRPIVGIAATPTSNGYWLVASDGGIFTFGDAAFDGSMGNRHLNRPIVGMAASPANSGYRLVASDGGVFCFGSAPFNGSEGNHPLNAPVVAIGS